MNGEGEKNEAWLQQRNSEIFRILRSYRFEHVYFAANKLFYLLTNYMFFTRTEHYDQCQVQPPSRYDTA